MTLTMARVLDSVTRTALLGVRFWDRVMCRAVADGLDVFETTSGTRMYANRSGVFVLHDLPGLRASAFGAGDNPFWGSPPAGAPISFSVVDAERRFVPISFTADVPLRGLFTEDCGLSAGSPPDTSVGGVPLFSAPTRTAPAGVAAVRADLWDIAASEPAACAVLEVSPGGGTSFRGIADAQGRVAVLFPYPEPPWHGSSPPPGSRSLSNQTWPVDVSVRYAPSGTAAPGERAPDLCALLTQAPGTLLGADSPTAALDSQTLAFGRELVLRTSGDSYLHVLPA